MKKLSCQFTASTFAYCTFTPCCSFNIGRIVLEFSSRMGCVPWSCSLRFRCSTASTQADCNAHLEMALISRILKFFDSLSSSAAEDVSTSVHRICGRLDARATIGEKLQTTLASKFHMEFHKLLVPRNPWTQCSAETAAELAVWMRPDEDPSAVRQQLKY